MEPSENLQKTDNAKKRTVIFYCHNVAKHRSRKSKSLYLEWELCMNTLINLMLICIYVKISALSLINKMFLFKSFVVLVFTLSYVDEFSK